MRLPSCLVDVCFAVDGSGSIDDAHAWGAEVSIVRSIVASIGGADGSLAVWLFSDREQEMVAPTTFGAAKSADGFTRAMVGTNPPFGSTKAAGALKQCTVSTIFSYSIA